MTSPPAWESPEPESSLPTPSVPEPSAPGSGSPVRESPLPESSLLESPVSESVLLERDLASVASARTWLAEFLTARDVEVSTIRDAVLLLSELVTNALRHGEGDIVCRVSMTDRDGSAWCVAVGDGTASVPQPLPEDEGRIGGFGLLLVERIADRWGVAAYPGGKIVWATVSDG